MSEDILYIGFNSLNIDIEGEIYEYLKYNDLLKLVCACTCLPETIILLKNKLYDAKIYDEIEILENLIKQLLSNPSISYNNMNLIKICVSNLRDKLNYIRSNINMKYHINKLLYNVSLDDDMGGYSYLIAKSSIMEVIHMGLGTVIELDSSLRERGPCTGVWHDDNIIV